MSHIIIYYQCCFKNHYMIHVLLLAPPRPPSALSQDPLERSEWSRRTLSAPSWHVKRRFWRRRGSRTPPQGLPCRWVRATCTSFPPLDKKVSKHINKYQKRRPTLSLLQVFEPARRLKTSLTHGAHSAVESGVGVLTGTEGRTDGLQELHDLVILVRLRGGEPRSTNMSCDFIHFIHFSSISHHVLQRIQFYLALGEGPKMLDDVCDAPLLFLLHQGSKAHRQEELRSSLRLFVPRLFLIQCHSSIVYVSLKPTSFNLFIFV